MAGVFTPASEALARALSSVMHPGERLACTELGFGFSFMAKHEDGLAVEVAWVGRSVAMLGEPGTVIDLVEDGLFAWRLERNR